MKIRLLIAAVLISVLSFGQTPNLVIKLTGPGVVFGENIPTGTILIDMSTSKEYLTLIPLLGTQKINDCIPLSLGRIKEISNSTHTGDVSGAANSDALTIGADKVLTSMIKDGEVQTNDIKDNNVTYAKIQKVAANRLLGNPSGALAIPQEITIGTGMSFSGNQLVFSAVSKFQFTDNYNNHGVYGSVTNASTTPTLGITLGSITPGTVDATGIVAGSQLQSKIGTGTPPLIVASATEVPNLRAATAAVATLATTADNLSGGLAGQVIYQSGPGATSKLSAGTAGQVLTSHGAGAPSWTFFPAYAVLALVESSVSGIYEWDPASGINASLDLTQDTRVKLIAPQIGTTGNLTILHTDGLPHELRLDCFGATNRYTTLIKKNLGNAGDQIVNTSLLIDNYSWYYDGTYVFWTGTTGFVE